MKQTYSPEGVTRLLRSYLDFRHYLLGEGSRSLAVEAPSPREIDRTPPKRELPLGAGPNDSRPWPFQEPRHARAPRDGKARAKQIQEIWVSILDLEAALKRLSDDDLALIYKFHLFQTHSLDELGAERGGVSRPAMTRRIQRAVERLATAMERPY